MTAAHHIIKEIHAKGFCAYCGNELKNKTWDSEFESENHYKTLECPECKKKNRIKVNFYGSGHDYWNGKSKKLKKESLEKKVKKNE